MERADKNLEKYLREEVDIPLEQQQEAQRRLKLVQEGKMKTRSWSEAKQDIFKR